MLHTISRSVGLAWGMGVIFLGLAFCPAEDLTSQPVALPPAATVTVDFARDIKPLLVARCHSCHGPDDAQGGLQLHRGADALEGGDSGPAFIVGDSAGSRLIRYVAGLEDGKQMPPDEEPLTSQQVALLRAWIDQGATWPASEDLPGKGSDHWAYQPLVVTARPAVSKVDWPRNDLDFYVLAKLESQGLYPSPEADPVTLLRRASLDLVGLPPTIAELDAFLADRSPQAYEHAVDRLLASSHYGERAARPWLDLARYADTHGFEKDPRREMSRYRDWVIDAFNRDLPFDQFTIEQIAGDMLPAATLEQQIASGFHRNTMTNTEGGVDPEEARVATIVDRVNTTATVWLGSTLGCAQCHTHKYDPFRQREYYQFYSLLNNADEPEIDAPTAAQTAAREAIHTQIAAVEQEMSRATPELAASQARWEQQLAAESAAWQVLTPAGFLSAGGATLVRQPEDSVLASGLNPANDTYTVVASTEHRAISGLRLEVLPDPSLPQHSLGRHENGSFVLTRMEVSAAPRGKPQQSQPVKLAHASADYSQQGHSAESLIDEKQTNGWAIGAGNPELRVARHVIVEFQDNLDFAEGATLTVKLTHASQFPEANVGRFRLSVSSGQRPLRAHAIPMPLREVLAIDPAARTDAQRAELGAYYRSIAPELEPLRAKIAELKKNEPAPTKALVMRERAEPRETFLQIRGNFLNPGRRVSAGVPAVLPPLPADAPANRLTLARWLVDPRNPLTPRVTVNRVWEQHFGLGIVATSEDFGTQGERPSHPELLDYLAKRLLAEGWSLKRLHREIVTSATYRQSSRTTPEMVERDPRNRLLARGPRGRVEAEMVRDIALTASGLLSHKIGGPSVFPPQPEGIWTQHYSGDAWKTSEGEDRYRRGLYTFWRRTSPYPTFMSFDAPSRESCTVRRSRTNTPLQALATMNDPAFVEAARALGKRMLVEPTVPAEASEHSAAEARASYGYRICLGTNPPAEELRPLVALYEQELATFRAQGEAARQLALGENTELPAGVDPASWAAWTIVGNVLLNLDATLSKE